METAQPTRMAFLRPFTNRVVNPIARRFVGRIPGFALVRHRGRRSGRPYRTPMFAFRDGDDYVFALTYGSGVPWVRNVLAAGRCELETRGRIVDLTDPRVFVDPRRGLMPRPVRVPLALMRVTEFLRMTPVAS
jgi:deazaflavin-dependent oxidoreductase (nitroreductase family)